MEAEAQKIVEDARAQAESILQDARSQAEAERADIQEWPEDRTTGSTGGSGSHRGCTRSRISEETADWKEYRSGWTMEPEFVDTITGIYEHISCIPHSYREVLCSISTTMRKSEDNRSFLIHVSKEDYPYVSMQKADFGRLHRMQP
ncbi:hypothetical protein [Waltera sp.]|uniref:hypothetical protein n=1 Tax=Waltera sp. TaxID=2815806 RepID=UPI0039907ECA